MEQDKFNPIYVMLGASNHTQDEREENDYYATDPKALELLLEKETFSPNVWECAVGGGHLAEVLKNHGYNVFCSDIIDRGYPNTQILDFLSFDSSDKIDADIVTNPPFKLASKFVEKALDSISYGHRAAFFLKLQFLEGKSRQSLFKKYPPKYIYVSSGRLLCAKNGDFEVLRNSGGSALALGWFIWEKGYTGKPTVEWFN